MTSEPSTSSGAGRRGEAAGAGSEVTPDLVQRYLDLTAAAREKATAIPDAESDDGRRLAKMMEMADAYAADARWFRDGGDLVRAFGAINYAHAWIDCAVKIGLLDGHGDEDMFTLP